MRRLALSPLFATLLLAGCVGRSADSDGRLGTAASEIVNGTPDVAHTAVVALLSNTSECSGTVVQVKGTNGYVLTAAHCCVANNLPQVVIFANDYATATPAQTHAVIPASVKQDPSWNMQNNTHDFCMLQFTGASGATPIIPVTGASDSLAVGTQVEFVGYGITAAPPGGANSVRRHKVGPIDQLDSLLVHYNESAGGPLPVGGGPCEGDSGGPALTTSGPLEVAAVTSAGDQSCKVFGISGRVSGAYANFIAPYLADQPVMPAMDCNTCATDAQSAGGACINEVTTCQQDPACAALVTCDNACAANDQACYTSCNTAHAAGVAKLQAIDTCLCTNACVSQCAAQCPQPAVCGLSSSTPACETCLEASCCSESKACAADASCTACLVQSPPASCAQVATLTALDTCLSGACAMPCGFPASSSSSSSSASSTTSSTGSSGMSSTTSSSGSSTSTSGASSSGASGSTSSTSSGVGGANTSSSGGATSSGVGGNDGVNRPSPITTGGCSVAPTHEDDGTETVLSLAGLAFVFAFWRKRR
jgi:hypothetical protein